MNNASLTSQGPEVPKGHVDFRNSMQGIPSEKFVVTPSVEAPVAPDPDNTATAVEPAVSIEKNSPPEGVVLASLETTPPPDLSPLSPNDAVVTGEAVVPTEKNTPPEVIDSASQETAPPADLHGREKWYMKRWKTNAEGITTLESEHELGSPEVSPSNSEIK
jgi:hypothetical protein